MRIFKVTATIHDFFRTVSRELKVGLPSPFIGNTTLLYALNHSKEKLHRVASGTIPFYNDDIESFPIYATPAEYIIANNNVVIKNLINQFRREDALVKITYNSVDSTQLVSMEQTVFHKKGEKLNFPKSGAYLCYPPLSTISFFTLAGSGPSIIRLGKKLPPVRAIYEELDNVRLIEEGEFTPDHVVQVQDLPEQTQILSGTMVVLPNGLLLSDARLKGPHYVGNKNRVRYVIAQPDLSKFSSVKDD